MAGELFGLLCLLRLRDILRATIASKEFKDTWEKTFWREVIVLENNEFQKYLLHRVVFSMHQCVSFNRLTRKFPRWKKLYYYVCQTDKLHAKYVKIAEVDSGHILELDKSMKNMRFMTNINDHYMNESDNQGPGYEEIPYQIVRRHGMVLWCSRVDMVWYPVHRNRIILGVKIIPTVLWETLGTLYHSTYSCVHTIIRGCRNSCIRRYRMVLSQ